ncbi:Oligopeptidase A [Saezia sanguinis]|uniref:oligopeptidase A n=1 Tax=Saezia sanguinis TaxID=1965230 RepID=A0A433SFY0_9BURK|nr:M3 family metallopeptidase [Saezia sanguinis]RUS67622.1 Oligopeptidase A [Saezia sanguinis]
MSASADIQNSPQNPLLDFSDLPRFADIRPEHVVPAIDDLLQKAQAALARAVSDDTPATWNGISQVLDVHTERLSRAWSAVSHLKAVKDTPELRQAVNSELPKITEFWTSLGQDERLFAKYKAIRQSDGYTQMNAAQKRALELALKGFVLSGAELQGEAKQRFAQIQEEMAQLTQRFSENLLDATDAWEMYVSEDELQGVPPDVLSAMRQAAQDKGQTGLRLSLQPPVYIPVMQYADNRALRETLYKAYVTRASDKGDTRYDNTALINQIVALRQEEAQLLGYANYGEVSLAMKMAESPQQVISFLRELASKARPYAQKDLKELREFAHTQLGIEALQAWDSAYASEKLKEARYAFSEQEVKAYFPQPKVMAGLFHIVQTLFDVQITEDQTAAAQQTWDSHVQLYRIERNGQLIGQFYTDLAARQGKRGGAWMDDVRGRWLRPDNGQLQTPVAQLVCNFASGIDGKPPLLTHDDVITTFHEFGHGLHHMLTQINELDVSGISGVEWDAVELPSQFMENFCWEWDVLKHITAHVDTGEALPRALYEKMLAAKNFQSGMQTVRQIEFSLFDMLLHASYDPATQTVQQLLDEVRQEVAVMIPPGYNRFQNSFSHIFAGGYAAGYYSYKWAEVLSADAYAAFEEQAQKNGQIVDPQTGLRYRREILEQGGSRPAMASFKAFRGREPSINALLRHQGMVDSEISY